MSMNLHCNKIELWQTRTREAYWCLTTDGKVNSSLRGRKAEIALQRYLDIWKLHHTHYHVKDIEFVMNDPDLEVWLM